MGSFSSLRAKLQLAEWKYAGAQVFLKHRVLSGVCWHSQLPTWAWTWLCMNAPVFTQMFLPSRTCNGSIFGAPNKAHRVSLKQDERHPFQKGGEIWSFFLQLKDSKALSQDQFRGGEKEQAHSEQLQNGAPSKLRFPNSVPNFLNMLIHSHLICAYWVPSSAFRRRVAKWG